LPKYIIGPYLFYCAFGAWYFGMPWGSLTLAVIFGLVSWAELQCLGVAFGDVLAGELPLHWAMVTDEFGTDPTLRFERTTAMFNALTMISKRVERGD
jgi:hypothetical protein